MLVPNTNRVLLKRLTSEKIESSILMPGQLKAGENLFVGEIVHPGTSIFSKGQLVYYSEYSAAKLLDIGAAIRKEKSLGDVTNEKETLYIVAEDDIMAYESDNKSTKT